MAECKSPEEDNLRKRRTRIPKHSAPITAPVSIAARLPTPNRSSTTHLPNQPIPILRSVVRRRKIITVGSDSEGGASPIGASGSGTRSAERSEGQLDWSALGSRAWGFETAPTRLGQVPTTKRQLHLGESSESWEGATQLNGGLGTASAQRFSHIAFEAAAIANKLLSDEQTEETGHQLREMLPGFEDGSYGFAELRPFLLTSLHAAHPSISSHPLSDDDGTPVWHVPNHKRKTQNTSEAAKNQALRCPVVREKDVDAIKKRSTDACKCVSHQTVTLDAVKMEREERASMSATGKRDQLNDLIARMVKKDSKGKPSLTGKVPLEGESLCAEVWRAILKVGLLACG
jgi:hypothetical protein